MNQTRKGQSSSVTRSHVMGVAVNEVSEGTLWCYIKGD
jgi:hypothetical protein